MPLFQALQPKGQVCRLQFHFLGFSPGRTSQLKGHPNSMPPLVLPAIPASHHVDHKMLRHISGLVAGLPTSSSLSALQKFSVFSGLKECFTSLQATWPWASKAVKG